MATSMTQLPLPIDFTTPNEGVLLFGEPNRAARKLLENWQQWPSPAAILTGPPRSGRSRLAARFAAESGGDVIDDANRLDETALFHAWNRAQSNGLPLLLVADAPPPIWSIDLPDLRTRLATAAQAEIAQPDLALTVALVTEGLSQAGTAFAPDVPDFLALRLPRCYSDIEQFLLRLNTVSLSTSRKISVALAKAELVAAGLILEG
jgi:hypothetical protein